eukprot:CAMPEP_0185784622 /NCGR_PEP_ID=MMETSP1174-20130828/124394_1 /TAXON_ID=35687 /ORGANISM="Dictyocha speculum, Strain CCMP1381" /LENGTH=41 /DNA_ID= /DNA_START= /DNA_END= /DNA_ORIENTATION=
MVNLGEEEGFGSVEPQPSEVAVELMIEAFHFAWQKLMLEAT